MEVGQVKYLKSLVVCCFLLNSVAFSEDYYVSLEGDDSNDGNTESAPLATLGEAAERAGSGDRVFLRYGDVFRDSARFGNMDIAPYGNKSDGIPIISGSVPVENWKVHDGDIYVADFTGEPGYLFVDNELVRIARYPNRGWLRTSTWTENDDGTNTVLTSDSLREHPRRAPGYWNGSNIRWHRHSWWFETRVVTDDDGAGMISLNKKSIIAVKPFDKNGWGFYMDNKLEELDTTGEWYYDESARKVYLWAPGNKNPNKSLVEVGVLDYGIRANEAIIREIGFRHQMDFGLQVGGTSTVTHCRFEQIGCDSGGTALKGVWNAHDSRIVHCLFRNNYNNGIGWNENPGIESHTIFEFDTLINTGMVEGYGGSGPWHGVGIVISNGSGMSVRRNRLYGTGYAGILLGSAGDTAEYNYIENAMATMNDGGAVYTNCDSSTIRHNIIVDTRGGMESSGPWANLAHGIWPEFLGDFNGNVIEHNTCVRSGGFGLFFPNNFDSYVRYNVFFDNGRAQIQLGGKETNSRTDRTENVPQNNTIERNVFFSGDKDQGTVLFRQEYDYGTLSNNYYCNPFRDSVIQEWGTGNKKWRQSWMTLSDWQSKYSWADESPKTEPFKHDSESGRGGSRILINDSFEERAVGVADNGVYVTVEGDTVIGSKVLAPFTSEVWIHTGTTNSSIRLPRFHPANGLSVALTSSGRIRMKGDRARRGLVVDIYASDGRRLLRWKPNSGGSISPPFASSGVYTVAIRTSRGEIVSSGRILSLD